jgi:enoyl-CoA hydratase
MSSGDQGAYSRVRYEEPAEGVARVVLARAEVANAQDYLLLSELNAALDRASRDSAVRVIILAADGKHFSSGHDLRDMNPSMEDFPVVGTSANFDAPGDEGYMDREREIYLGYCRRWRDIPKPTIAQVQGKVIAGGLMLMWPMDLIVCAEDATFCDPVVALGANGVEYFVHPYELGVRAAKDMLFTGRSMTAREAFRRGMVQRMFPVDDLEQATLDLACQIAQRPSFALGMAKRSVNLAQDAMGFDQVLEASFAMHHLLHSHVWRVTGTGVPDGALETFRSLVRADSGTAGLDDLSDTHTTERGAR